MRTEFFQSAQDKVASTDPNQWSREITSDFGENAWAMAKQMGREHMAISAIVEELRDRPGVRHAPSAARVGRDMLRDGRLSEDEVAFALVVPPDWMDEEPYYKWDEVGKLIRQKYPDVELDLRSERLARRNEVIDHLRADEERILAAATGMGKVGQFVGGLPPLLIDPPNVVAMMASPWTNVPKAGRLLQYSAIAAESLVVEGMTAPSVAAHKQALGLEYGSKEIARDMIFSTVGALGLKGAVDAGSVLASRTKAIKSSPLAGTIDGQKVLRNLEEAQGEVKVAEAAGKPLDEMLEATDQVMADIETPRAQKSLVDEETFPGLRNYENEADLQADFDRMVAERGDAGIPVDAKEVDGQLVVTTKKADEMFSDIDVELEKTAAMRACYGL